MITLDFWFMFPVGIMIATIAMMSGVGGATMFTPLFLLGLHLEPTAALASGLFIEVFGFTSGVIGYARKKLIKFSLVKQILPYTLLGTVGGVLMSQIVPKGGIELVLAVILAYVAIQFLRSKKECVPVMWPAKSATKKKQIANTLVISRWQRLAFTLGGGLFGTSSSGLGEVNEYVFLERLKLKSGSASGTSVFIIAISALVAATFQTTLLFLGDTTEVFSTVLSLIVFTVPGVVIGAQIGVLLAARISTHWLEKIVGVLFGTLAVIIVSSLFW